MYGFEQQIAANQGRTAALMVVFTILMAALGWAAGYWIDPKTPELGYFMLAGFMIFALISTGVSYWYSDAIITRMVNARPANPTVYIEKYFMDTVEGLVLACGLPAVPKCYIMDSPALNAFATGRDPQHSLIAVTSGLLAALDRQELEGVIAHEMSHIYDRDILLMGVAAVLVGGISMFCHLLLRMMFWGGGGGGRRDSKSGGGGGALLMVVALVLIILAPLFANLLNLMISRKREFLADATSVKLTRNPEGLINALTKISQSTEKMPNVESELAGLFIDDPQKKKSAVSGMAALLATHPPIEERIAALKAM
jgi:heat shock protein HtpX